MNDEEDLKTQLERDEAKIEAEVEKFLIGMRNRNKVIVAFCFLSILALILFKYYSGEFINLMLR